MPPLSRKPGRGEVALPGLELHPALVHVLTSEFQNIDPTEFEDIPDEYVAYVHPNELRNSLLESNSQSDGNSVVSYRGVEGNKWNHLAVTPEEFGLFARHVPMLARTAINQVLHARDKKLQEETGDPSARARTDADRAAADRAAMRQVTKKSEKMRGYLEAELEPRIKLIKQFTEMTQHKNLARGNYVSVKERVERLRTEVFGDMLDAIGNQRGWTESQSNLAERTLKKRLYLDPNKARRVENFKAMLELADDYYGHKYALVLGRIAESDRYRRKHADVWQDVLATDASRQESTV